MTSTEITLFIGRLQRRELAQGELLALTTRDLDAIRRHLTEHPRGGETRGEPFPRGRPQTFTEAEILAELGPS